MAQKDQLGCTWCVWAQFHQHDIPEMQTSTIHVYDFDSESNWRAFGGAKPPSKLGIVDLFVFEKGFLPAEVAFPRGGRWIVELGNSFGLHVIDQLWDSLVVGVIGHGCDSCACGVAISCRPDQTQIALWLSESSAAKALSHGRCFRALLSNFGFRGELNYQKFDTEDSELALTTGATFSAHELPRELDTGQLGRQPPQLIKINIPGVEATSCYQLVLKNSFISEVISED